MTKHNGARWRANLYHRIWGLYARERDGGALLGRVVSRDGKWFWGLGDAFATNEATSPYAAQRAVRKALREQR